MTFYGAYAKLCQVSPLIRHLIIVLPSSSIPADLHNAKFVFIRRDGHRPPLTPPYDGPYEVLSNNGKTLTVNLGGRHELVSVDRINVTHYDPTDEVAVAQPPRRGRPSLPASPAKPPDQSKTVTRFGRHTQRPQ